jgi:hypothetical protein
MKSLAVLGLGVIALTGGAVMTTGAAMGSRLGTLKGGSYFEASVQGGMDARPAGDVAYGVVGDTPSGVAAFTITLAGSDSTGAILFTSLDGRLPAPGRYELTEGGAIRAMYVAGSVERPTGLFRAERGTLEITASDGEHLSGHFSFTGAGFMAADPSDEGSEVTVNGAFMSTRVPAGRPVQP